MRPRVAILWCAWALAACSAVADPERAETDTGVDEHRTVVTYWRHHTQTETRAARELIARFEAEHPEIRVALKTFPYGVYKMKVVATLTSGQGPDIVNIHGSWAYGYIDSGLIVPIPDEVLSRRELNEEFFPLARAFSRQGVYYAIPIGASNLGLFYNRAMFRDAGLERPPRTWSELAAMAQRLTRRDPSGRLLRSGASLANDPGSQGWNYFVDGILPQAGVTLLSDDGRSVAWNTPRGAAALKWYTDFSHGPNAPNSVLFPPPFDAFRLGLAAMMVKMNETIGSLTIAAPDLDYDTAPVPSSDTGTRATFGSAWGNAVTRISSGKTRAAAFELVRFLARYESMVAWSKTTGELPMRARVLEDEAYLVGAGKLRPFLEQMPYARMSLRKDEGAYRSAIVDAIGEVLFNDKAPAAALEQAASRVNEMLERH